jgi:hypothetical protein
MTSTEYAESRCVIGEPVMWKVPRLKSPSKENP